MRKRRRSSCGSTDRASTLSEINGLRPWRENRAVIAFAEAAAKPVISGGDRHGLEPNANLNLTNAANFAEFADEVRTGWSDILIMPH